MSRRVSEFPKFLKGRHGAAEQEAWWYADRGGIDVLCATGNSGGGANCTAVRLTWGQIRKAMARKARTR